MNYNEFKKTYKIKLNEQQESAICRTDGQTLLLAVPGSGKTTVIVARLGYLLFCCNTPSENILTMTYNVSAAADMKQRFIQKFGEENTGRQEFRTINGFCATVILYYERVRNTNAFRLMDESQATKIIRAIYLNMTHEYPSESMIKEIKTKLVFSRNMMLRADEIKKMKIGETDFYEFFMKYKQYKQQNRIMDYDDQLEFALKILLNNPDILAYYQNRYRYINIDEAQDTSKIQHMIIRLLANRYKNIFMVGDEDQSIYGFRAAYPQALLEFKKVYPDSSILLMEKNYRSTADIVAKANDFIKLNKCRHDKNMITDNECSVPIKNIVLKDYKNQYSYILKMIEDSNEELAVLYRNNDSALPIIDLLEKNGISYRLKENDGIFFSVNIVVDILNILTFSLSPASSSLFAEFYYKIGLRMKKDIITSVMRLYGNSSGSFLDILEKYPATEKWQQKKINELKRSFAHLRRLNCYSAILYIVHKMEYNEYMKERGMDESKIQTMLAIANQNPEIPLFLERMKTLNQIVHSGSSVPESNVIVSTIHSSKGLEYENVLMIDVRDGIFPSVTVDEKDEKDIPKELRDTLEEERRLFYVGVTRAKKSFSIFSYETVYGEACETATFTKQLLKIENKKIKDKLESKKKQSSKAITGKLKEYKKGSCIIHTKYGKGIIKELNLPVCRIQLENSDEIRSFDIEYCISHELVSLAK